MRTYILDFIHKYITHMHTYIWDFIHKYIHTCIHIFWFLSGVSIRKYAHTYIQGVIWRICSFDQWGVELGKVLVRASMYVCMYG